MKLSCPNCGHVACNLCAVRTARTKIPGQRDSFGVHGVRSISCHKCKIDNAEEFWKKIPEPRVKPPVDTQGDFWKGNYILNSLKKK